jgi:hypothetical protein
VNHTQRIAHVARQRRSLTKALVREAVERYLEALAEEVASGEWVDIPASEGTGDKGRGQRFRDFDYSRGTCPPSREDAAGRKSPVREVQATMQKPRLRLYTSLGVAATSRHLMIIFIPIYYTIRLSPTFETTFEFLSRSSANRIL